MLVSTEGFIAVGFFNIPAGLDLNNNMLSLNTSVTISLFIYWDMTGYRDPSIDKPSTACKDPRT